MRLLVEISPKQDTPQPLNSYHLQCFIYALLRNTRLEKLHNLTQYKYFCFSNIFPYKPNQPFQAGKKYNLIISSPETDFIHILQNKLAEDRNIKLGKYYFKLIGANTVRVRIQRESVIKTTTPIVASIPASLYLTYGLESKRKYLYWNSKMPLNALVDLASQNAVRKFNSFYKDSLSENLLLFRTYRFKRGALVEYKQGKIAGSMWEFMPADNNNALKVLNFIIDAGLGEKNSAGFGFLGIK